jgi:hypothetical protein
LSTFSIIQSTQIPEEPEKNFMIIEINFSPNSSLTETTSRIELQGPDRTKFLKRSNSSSDHARNSALTYLDNFSSCSELTIEKMVDVHEKALKIALDEAEKHKGGMYSSCGGTLFFQPRKL